MSKKTKADLEDMAPSSPEMERADREAELEHAATDPAPAGDSVAATNEDSGLIEEGGPVREGEFMRYRSPNGRKLDVLRMDGDPRQSSLIGTDVWYRTSEHQAIRGMVCADLGGGRVNLRCFPDGPNVPWVRDVPHGFDIGQWYLFDEPED